MNQERAARARSISFITISNWKTTRRASSAPSSSFSFFARLGPHVIVTFRRTRPVVTVRPSRFHIETQTELAVPL